MTSKPRRIRLGRAGVYKITHVASDRCYVGSSADIDERWKDHIRDFRGGRHHSPYFKRVWAKYGQDAFVFETLEECDITDVANEFTIGSREWGIAVSAILAEHEQVWIDKYHPVFNSAPVAGSPLGFKHTDETRAKLRILATGRKQTPESIEKTRQANLGNKRLVGYKHSPESRAKTSATLKGRPKSPEHIAKLIGRIVSDETKAKISASRKAYYVRKKATEQNVFAQ